MASVNLQSKDGGGDGYCSPARSVGFSSPWIKSVSDDGGELSSPVVSVTSPAASSSSIHEQFMNAAVDWYLPDTSSSPDESDTGCQVERSDGGGNTDKKPVWSKPSNGVVEVVSPVMDAVSWPALGESTPKSSASSESLQPLSHQSSPPALQVPVGSSPSPQKPATVIVNPVSSHKPAKPAIVLKPQPNTGNHRYYQHNSYRRSNGGPHPRTDGSYCRGVYNNMPPQHGGYRRGGYTRPPAHNSTPFVQPPMPLQVRPFGNNVIYPADVLASGMIYYPGPPPPIFLGPYYFPVQDPLHDKIISQIDFYFSNDNLVKDTYLRRYMDEHGWVPVSLIAKFNKVLYLTDNVQVILDAMKKSTVVEVQGDKMRRRNDWMRWLIPPAVQDLLGSRIQGIQLDERAPIA